MNNICFGRNYRQVIAINILKKKKKKLIYSYKMLQSKLKYSIQGAFHNITLHMAYKINLNKENIKTNHFCHRTQQLFSMLIIT